MNEPLIPRYPAGPATLRREAAIVLIGVVLIIAAAGGAWMLFFQPNTPQSIVRRFIEAERAGRDAETARLVSGRWDSRMVLAALQTFRQQSGLSLFEQYAIRDAAISGQTATVNVEVTHRAFSFTGQPAGAAPRYQTLRVPFVLVREADEWRIDPTQTLAGLTGALLGAGLNRIGPLPPIFGPGGPAPAHPAPANPTPPSSI